MLNGKKNLCAESYKKCKERKFWRVGSNMHVYFLNPNVARIFLMNVGSFFLFFFLLSFPFFFKMLPNL